MSPNKKFLIETSSLTLSALLVAASGCGSHANNPDTSGTTTQLAAQTVGGAVSSTNADSIALNDSRRESMYAAILRELSPIAEAFAGAFGVCPTIVGGAAGGSCTLSGDSISLAFPTDGCTYGGVTGPIWQGGTVVTVATPPAGFTCGGSYPPVDSSNVSLTRTYLGNLLASPTSVTAASGSHAIVIDTSAPTATAFASAATSAPTAGTIGWNYSLPSGGGYERSFVSATDHNLSVSVRLVGYLGTAATGTVEFDHTLSTTNAAGTSTPLNVLRAGSGLDLTETVNGTLNLQHNLMKMTASSQFNSVKHEVGCCYPIDGEIVTSFSGGVNDGLQESMQFSAATCELATLGQVQFTDVNGTISTKTLDRCF